MEITTNPGEAASHGAGLRAPALPRRRVVAVAALALAIVGGLITSAAPASAWQYGSSTGQPGAVTATAQVNVGKLSNGMWLQVTLFGNTGPTVSRSAATTGAQDVSILYSVQRWNGVQWTQVAQQMNTMRMATGVQQARLPALYVQPTAGTGYYRVVEAFQWNVAGTNTVLGTTTVWPSATSDHVCQYLPCAATVGYVWAG